MKRVLIQTWWKLGKDNYGQVLQAVAMSEIIKKQCYDVDLLNYNEGPRLRRVEKTSYLSLFRQAGKVIKRIFGKSNLVEFDETAKRRFEDFRKKANSTSKVITTGEFENLNHKYDVFVCGSDQIWNPCFFSYKNYLTFVNNNHKKVAYAPSMAVPTINDKYIEEFYVKQLVTFDNLSVRENESASLIKELTGADAKTVLDPTMLLSAEEWSEIAQVEKGGNRDSGKYILYYFLHYDRAMRKNVEKISKKLGLKIKRIPTLARDFKKTKCGIQNEEGVGPAEFINLIKNASYVCTDSFHGMVFSVIFNRPFSIYLRSNSKSSVNMNSRILTLFDTFDLKDRLYTSKNKCLWKKEINWGYVNEVLKGRKKYALDYLSNALKSACDAPSHSVIKANNTPTRDCAGCGLCAKKCPHGAISIELNERGFYSALVDRQKCTNCGLCENVCVMRDERISKSVKEGKYFSYKTKDINQLKKSTSGGLCYSIAKNYSLMGYDIFGCAYDKNKRRALHVKVQAGDICGLDQLTGSKYIQSDFSFVMNNLLLSKKAVVFGTPCQIAAAKGLIPNERENDFVLVELICHGVPSYIMYDRYIEYINSKKRLGTNPNVTFRSKKKGWKSNIYIYREREGRKPYLASSRRDMFYKYFLSDICLMDSCYECHFRRKTCADIRVGDYWGSRFNTDRDGVNMVCAYSKSGENVLNSISSVGEFKEQPLTDYVSAHMPKCTQKPLFTDEMLERLKKGEDFKKVYYQYNGGVEKKQKIMRLACLLIPKGIRNKLINRVK